MGQKGNYFRATLIWNQKSLHGSPCIILKIHMFAYVTLSLLPMLTWLELALSSALQEEKILEFWTAITVFEKMAGSLLFNEDLRDLIECVVCLEVPNDPPIYQCENGHILCEECYEECLPSCPTCRIHLEASGSRIRSRIAEKALERYDY